MDAKIPCLSFIPPARPASLKSIAHHWRLFAVHRNDPQIHLDYHDGDIYWCTADIGWITGHSYMIYGPLCNGATTLMFEGVPTYPEADRFWNIIDKHQVNIFYTAPTVIRALMAQGNDFVTRSSRRSLRILGSVGEPIN
jgi:acetyl-CoA synthetase